MSDLESILDFAREEGFEVVSGRKVLLPLGKIEDYEYGLAIDEYGVYPLGYTRQDSRTPNYSSSYVSCYVINSVVKTLELSDGKTFVLEKDNKEEVNNKKQGLIIAAKFKDVGTLDPTFINRAYPEILKLLPSNLAQAELAKLMLEVKEKLEQAENMRILPEYYQIINNLTLISEAYTATAKGLGINPETMIKSLKTGEALKAACLKTPQDMYADEFVKKIICTYKQYPEMIFRELDDEALVKLAGVSAVFAKRSENGITLEDSKFFADFVRSELYRDEFFKVYAEHFLKKGSTQFSAEVAKLIQNSEVKASMLETIINSAWKKDEHDICKSSIEQIQDAKKHDKLCLELADMAAGKQHYDICLDFAKLVKENVAERDNLCNRVLNKLNERDYKMAAAFTDLLHDQAEKDDMYKDIAKVAAQICHDYDECHKILKLIQDEALHDSLCTELARSTAENENYKRSADFVNAIKKSGTKKTAFIPFEIYNFALRAGLEGNFSEYDAAIGLLKAAEEVDSPFSDQMLERFCECAQLTDYRIGFIKSMKSEDLRNELCKTYSKLAVRRCESYEYAEIATSKKVKADIFEKIYENLLELHETNKEEFASSVEAFKEGALPTLIDIDSSEGNYKAATLAALQGKWDDFEYRAENISDGTKRDRIYSKGALMRWSKEEGLENAGKIGWSDLRNKTYYEMGLKCLYDHNKTLETTILGLLPKDLQRRDDLAFEFALQAGRNSEWSQCIKYAEQMQDTGRRRAVLERFNIKHRLFGYERYNVGNLFGNKVCKVYRSLRYRRLARERKSWGHSAEIGAGIATLGTFLNYIAPYYETNLPVPLQVLGPLLIMVGCADAAGSAAKYDGKTRELLRTKGIAT